MDGSFDGLNALERMTLGGVLVVGMRDCLVLGSGGLMVVYLMVGGKMLVVLMGDDGVGRIGGMRVVRKLIAAWVAG